MINKEISSAKDVDTCLKRYMSTLDIKYKPEIFIKQEQILNELKRKYKSDK